MPAFKSQFLRISNICLSAALTFLGFASSCNGRMEYGMPSAKFKVTGKVTSALNGQPVQNIKVVMSDDSASYTADSTYTRSDGTYKAEVIEFPMDHSFTVRFQDMDGTEHGSFKAADTSVVFKDPKYHGGDGDWYEGETDKEVNIKLKPGE